MNGTSRRLPIFLSVLVAFLTGVYAGRAPALWHAPTPSASPISAPGLPPAISVEQIREAWDIIHEKFSGPLRDEDLAEGALRGIVAGTGDPYTAYADPEESQQLTQDLNGTFFGIGVEIGLRNGLVTVIAPLRGSPAERAGLRARDLIVSIDGEKLNLRPSLNMVVGKIRGEEGTMLRLGIVREGEDGIKEFTIRRERIHVESVKTEIRDGIGILIISSFNEDTPDLMDKAARTLLEAGVRGIIIDLRNNPGGLLGVSVDIAGHFVPRGSIVVQEVPRASLKRNVHKTRGRGELGQIPTVVLVNGGSASASEILAAALHELQDIPLVGEQTFGKGSVQELVELSNEGTIRVTVARWHTPQDREITEEGIAPTVAVKDARPEDPPDEILEKGIEILKDRLR